MPPVFKIWLGQRKRALRSRSSHRAMQSQEKRQRREAQKACTTTTIAAATSCPRQPMLSSARRLQSRIVNTRYWLPSSSSETVLRRSRPTRRWRATTAARAVSRQTTKIAWWTSPFLAILLLTWSKLSCRSSTRDRTVGAGLTPCTTEASIELVKEARGLQPETFKKI